MKQLKFKFDLSSKVSIYVPTTVNVNEPMDNSAQVQRVMTKLCTMFGGATASDARGGWVQVYPESGSCDINYDRVLDKFNSLVNGS